MPIPALLQLLKEWPFLSLVEKNSRATARDAQAARNLFIPGETALRAASIFLLSCGQIISRTARSLSFRSKNEHQRNAARGRNSCKLAGVSLWTLKRSYFYNINVITPTNTLKTGFRITKRFVW